MIFALGLAGVLLLSLLIRLSIIWQHRHRGCDAYYFLLSSNQFRTDKKVPITLPPVYLLEEQEQWYPPGFSVFLSWIPQKTLEKHYWAVSPVLDSLLAGMVYTLAYYASGNTVLGLLAGAMYALNCTSIPDTTSLSSRSLGALLFTTAMLFLLWFTSTGSFGALVIFVLFGVLLLVSRKLDAQLLYILLPFMAIATGDLRYLLSLALLIVAVLLLPSKLMLKIWKGQYDILSFWARNWKQLGAHQIYGSPMYKQFKDRDNRKFHDKGLRGVLKGLPYLGMNTFALPATFAAVRFTELTAFEQHLIWWVIGTYLWATLTQLVPQMKFLGEGYRYLKLCAVPVCYLAIAPLVYGWDMGYLETTYVVALGLSFLGAVAVLVRLYRFMNNRAGTTIPFMDNGLREVIEKLKQEATENILCIPDGLGDAVGYYTGKGVLRGTHNLPFQKVTPFFPAYKLPLDYLAKGYRSSHVVLDKSYVEPGEVEVEKFAELEFSAGDYALYRVAH